MENKENEVIMGDPKHCTDPRYVPAKENILKENILFAEGNSVGLSREVVKITKDGFFYNDQYIADAGEAHALLLKVMRMYQGA